jgi:hypothetical protein
VADSVNAVIFRMKSREFVDYLSDYLLIEKVVR